MFKKAICFFLILFSFSLFAGKISIKDSVVFVVEDNVVTESDLRAYAYIFGKDVNPDRKELLEKVVKIEKSYYCLKENYPFEGEFEREFSYLFYRLNLFYQNRFLDGDKLKKCGIDFNVLKDNLFKLLFVIKYSVLLSGEESDCLKKSVYFVDN